MFLKKMLQLEWISTTLKLFLFTFPPKIRVAHGDEFSNYNSPAKK